MFEDFEEEIAPYQPWLYLVEPQWRAWREKQFAKGRDPDSYIEEKLKEAGVWPPKGSAP